MSVKSLTTKIISSSPCTSQPRSLHLVHLNKPYFTFSGLLGKWGLNGIFCIEVYSSLIMACNTYMYNLYYLLYAGIGFWSLNTLSKMEKSLLNSSYQQQPGVDPRNSEKGGWDTCPLASYIETFYCSENSIKIIQNNFKEKRPPLARTPWRPQ